MNRELFWLFYTFFFSCLPLFAKISKSTEAKVWETTPSLPMTQKESLNRQELTTEDVELFFDEIIPLQIQQTDIADAFISVVKDGKSIFAKDYGFSDTVKEAPLSPDKTLFRLDSISKLFIGTTPMQ